MTEKFDIFDEIELLEDRLGIPKGFFISLNTEGDWAFVIKLHALFEAAVAHAVVEKLGHQELQEAFSYLDMSNNKFGKARFAKQLGLLTPDEFQFVRLLSELRNDLVHDIRNVNFSFKNYLDKMSQKDRKTFVKQVTYSMNEGGLMATFEDGVKGYAVRATKSAIWVASIEILAMLYLHADRARMEKQSLSTRSQLYEVYSVLYKDQIESDLDIIKWRNQQDPEQLAKWKEELHDRENQGFPAPDASDES